MNQEKTDFCLTLLVACEKWSLPGPYGCFPEMRVLVYNNFSCCLRRMGSPGIALNYQIKALKLIGSAELKEFRGLSHMNMGSLLLELGE